MMFEKSGSAAISVKVIAPGNEMKHLKCFTEARSRRDILWIAVLLLLVQIGCSGSSDEVGDQRARRMGNAANLSGSWQGSCLDPQIPGAGEIANYTFDGDFFTRSSVVTASGVCVNRDIETRLSGRSERLSQGRGLTFQLNLTTESARIKPVSELGVTLLNIAKTCGSSSWRLNEEREVVSKIGREGCFASNPKQMFTIYSVDEGRLYFGSGIRFNSAEKRPVEVERGIGFAKK